MFLAEEKITNHKHLVAICLVLDIEAWEDKHIIALLEVTRDAELKFPRILRIVRSTFNFLRSILNIRETSS